MVKFKRVKQICLIAMIAICFAGTSQAISYEFKPTPTDMYDLEHQYYYLWKINWTLPAGEIITGATLEFKNIWDWKKENDILYIHLLDNPSNLSKKLSNNLWRGADNEGGGDYWTGKGPLIGTWSDPNGGNNGDQKVPLLSFSLPLSDSLFADLTDLENFSLDGKWGLGLDPDCHYFTDEVKFTITTSPVPEPSTMLLLGSGLTGLFFLRNKFKK